MIKIFNKNIYRKGMTLVELMVVMAIFIIILGITIFDYSSYKSTVAIQNLADDIALSVRKAQTYAMGSKSLLTGAAQGFGVHFSINEDTGAATSNLIASNKRFIIYSDLNDPNRGYNNPGSGSCGSPTKVNECLDSIGINSNAKIIGIKLGDNVSMSAGQSLAVYFVRPNPDARFCLKNNPTSPNCSKTEADFSSVTIYVASSKVDKAGKPLSTKEITIRTTGQINVK